MDAVVLLGTPPLTQGDADTVEHESRFRFALTRLKALLALRPVAFGARPDAEICKGSSVEGTMITACAGWPVSRIA